MALQYVSKGDKIHTVLSSFHKLQRPEQPAAKGPSRVLVITFCPLMEKRRGRWSHIVIHYNNIFRGSWPSPYKVIITNDVALGLAVLSTTTHLAWFYSVAPTTTPACSGHSCSWHHMRPRSSSCISQVYLANSAWMGQRLLKQPRRSSAITSG